MPTLPLNYSENSVECPPPLTSERRLATMESLAGDLEAQKRFWRKVKVGELNDCWPWTLGVSSKGGYGLVTHRQMTLRAHRVAARLSFGPFLNASLVCHRCDNPPCCNPIHLFFGSNLDNQIDCIQKKRNRKAVGIDAACVKLTPEQVLGIRQLAGHLSHKRIAEQFGVGKTTIGSILNRVTWKHI